ncbi:hypothetical protein SWZG_00289 [Synechococcus phage S-SKS1]|uniref:Uncharacterized protein n=1 Tax=Synechococcus phage S-SKS1 TaxID=754042 RepID=M4R1Z4_9CAUD|nr:hypothetical protein SWZG_00289 [Synechococcus phage S-SKS1]AGH31792.1 hypothetical protein SWZG_00289 [Synechococcus phage S-SKS1]
MAIIGDVFGLTSIYEKQVENIDNNNFESWPESATYGYFGGGQNPAESPSTVNTVDRIDFSNETASAPGNNLSLVKYALAVVSSSSYGYFGGGRDLGLSPSYVNTVDRIDFSNETASAPGNNLPQVRAFLAGTSSNSYGYFGGGQSPAESPSTVNTIDRLDFSNETTSAPGNNLPQARYYLATVSNSSYGYFGGGLSPDFAIDRIDFSNETTSPVTATLPEGRFGLAAVSSSSYGYFGGGYATPFVGTVDRIDFSNETTSAPGNNLSQARSSLAAVSSSSYGYFGGGFAPPYADTIDRIDFSNETTSPVTDTLSQARRDLAAVSGGASERIKGSRTYGYFGGGQTVNTIDRIDFSNETTSAPGDNLPQARSGLAAVSSSSYGYFAGGGTPTQVDTIDRIDFSNETTSPVTATLPQARSNLAAVSSSSYGYFGGGSAPPQVTTVDRIDFLMRLHRHQEIIYLKEEIV